MSSCLTDSFYDPNSRRSLSESSLSGLWQSRLRACRSGSVEHSALRNSNAVNNTNHNSNNANTNNSWETPRRVNSTPHHKNDPSSTGSSVTGLTPSISRSRAISARRTTPRTISAVRGKSNRTTPLKEQQNITCEVHRRFDPVSKNLFQKEFLLQALEPHEPQPALTVVFDLDETLVSNRNVNLPSAILRPYCLHVLNALRHMKNLEIVLWTASTKETASSVVEQLHDSGTVFDDLIFRSKLWFTEPVHTKDLRLLGRDLDRVVIIDNSANCCKLHSGNSILIDDFHGFRHTNDAALINVYYMIEFLLKNANAGGTVSEGLDKLVEEGHLCRRTTIPMPEAWRSLPLSEIPPLKIPPCGDFVRCNTAPPSESIMKYWSY